MSFDTDAYILKGPAHVWLCRCLSLGYFPLLLFCTEFKDKTQHFQYIKSSNITVSHNSFTNQRMQFDKYIVDILESKYFSKINSHMNSILKGNSLIWSRESL